MGLFRHRPQIDQLPEPASSLDDAYRAQEAAQREYAQAVSVSRDNIVEANRHRAIRRRNGIGPAFAEAYARGR